MKKKIFAFAALVLVFAGCTNKNSVKFKNDYEEINDKTNSLGNKYRTVTISKNNKFKEVTPKDIVKKINNKETFYVYFGSRLCPWCRSVIEKADSVSRKSKVDVIYYVDIWDDLGNEIFRDKYELVDQKPSKTYKGTDEYFKIIAAINKELLKDYVIGEDTNVGEKRIFAPNFVYFKNGKGIKLTNGKSESLTDPRGKLTKKILKDQEKMFTEFFKD